MSLEIIYTYLKICFECKKQNILQQPQKETLKVTPPHVFSFAIEHWAKILSTTDLLKQSAVSL